MKNQIRQRNKKHPVLKVLQYLTTALLIISTALCFFVVISSTVKRDVSLFGYRIFYVVSGSMEPTIPVGTLLVVGESDEYEVDDIITFYSKDDTIKGYPNTHRIIDKRIENGEVRYITKGDANPIEDQEPVSPEDIIGKVCFSLNSSILSRAVEFFGTPIGFFTLVLLPMLFVAISAMRSFIKAFKEEIHNAALASLNEGQANTEECQEDEKRQNDRDSDHPAAHDGSAGGYDGSSDTTE